MRTIKFRLQLDLLDEAIPKLFIDTTQVDEDGHCVDPNAMIYDELVGISKAMRMVLEDPA